MASSNAAFRTAAAAVEVALAEEQAAELDLVEQGAVVEADRSMGLLRLDDRLAGRAELAAVDEQLGGVGLLDRGVHDVAGERRRRSCARW